MLIALCECLEERDTATAAIREILWRTINKMYPDGLLGKTKEEVSIGEQMELVETWEEHRDHGPLAPICALAACLLFDLNVEKGDKEHSEVVAAVGAAIVDDAWEVI